MRYKVFTEPSVEPITAAEAKAHLRVTGSDEDTYISGLITAARKYAEAFCRRKFISTVLDAYMDDVPSGDILELRPGPVSAVTEIKYYDTNDAVSTFSSSYYRLDTYSEPARVVLDATASWPSGLRDYDGFYVKWTAGYGTATTSVPEPIRHAIKLLVAHWYELREPVNVGNITSPLALMVHSLLLPYKTFRV